MKHYEPCPFCHDALESRPHPCDQLDECTVCGGFKELPAPWCDGCQAALPSDLSWRVERETGELDRRYRRRGRARPRDFNRLNRVLAEASAFLREYHAAPE